MFAYILVVWILLALVFVSVLGAIMSLLRTKSIENHPMLRRLVLVLRIVGILWVFYSSIIVVVSLYPHDLTSYVRSGIHSQESSDAVPLPLWTIVLYIVLLMMATGSFLGWESWAHHHHSDLVGTTIITTDAIIVAFPWLVVFFVGYVGYVYYVYSRSRSTEKQLL